MTSHPEGPGRSRRPRPPPPRRARSAVLVRDNAPELRLLHQWLDSWMGIGLVVVGMSHLGFTVSLGSTAPAAGWSPTSTSRCPSTWTAA
jgi:hypothetical protein